MRSGDCEQPIMCREQKRGKAHGGATCVNLILLTWWEFQLMHHCSFTFSLNVSRTFYAESELNVYSVDFLLSQYILLK